MFGSSRTAQKHDNRYEYQTNDKTQKCTLSHSETAGAALALGAADRLSSEETLRTPKTLGPANIAAAVSEFETDCAEP